jgi:hypothetical protein
MNVVASDELSCATSSGVQASMRRRADAAARNEVRFTAKFSRGARASAFSVQRFGGACRRRAPTGAT